MPGNMEQSQESSFLSLEGMMDTQARGLQLKSPEAGITGLLEVLHEQCACLLSL